MKEHRQIHPSRMSALTNFSLLASPRTWTAFTRYKYSVPELNNEAPSDPSQQNVSSDQLLTVGITKDIDCIQEIPMLVLNNEALSDPSRRMSALTNFSLLASPRTWTAFKRYQYTLCTRIEQ
ncbi:uncharacterized protein [Diadema setosum]|uniref:uncharacterized protein n=1 Tax=Diadema setosum TaxID=31175 RepID=UPI003B3A28BB